jgi:Ca2+-binding RTX toxin-like protein
LTGAGPAFLVSAVLQGRKVKVVVATSVVLFAGAGVALATFQPTVSYNPPLIEVRDHPSHLSVEDITVRRAGNDFTIINETSPSTTDPGSDPGCTFISGGVSCPRAGVEKIVVFLGAEDDDADIKLGKSADKVKQILKGQDGEDGLQGGNGTQKLVGGDNNDLLIGGAGRDILLGGAGEDACNGGPGKDIVKGCELGPVR